MSHKLARYKPGVQQKTHLLLAASLWTGIGIFLMWRGFGWLSQAGLVLWAAPAVAVGFFKSHYILDDVATKSIDRILMLKDGTCMGAVYSKATWLLVLVMMTAGFFLRKSTLPRPILGVCYIAIGWALFWSSRNGWKAWWRKKSKA